MPAVACLAGTRRCSRRAPVLGWRGRWSRRWLASAPAPGPAHGRTLIAAAACVGLATTLPLALARPHRGRGCPSPRRACCSPARPSDRYRRRASVAQVARRRTAVGRAGWPPAGGAVRPCRTWCLAAIGPARGAAVSRSCWPSRRCRRRPPARHRSRVRTRGAGRRPPNTSAAGAAARAHRPRRTGPDRPRTARRGRPPHLDDRGAGRDGPADHPGLPPDGAQRLVRDRRHRADRADRDAAAARRAARGRPDATRPTRAPQPGLRPAQRAARRGPGRRPGPAPGSSCTARSRRSTRASSWPRTASSRRR